MAVAVCDVCLWVPFFICVALPDRFTPGYPLPCSDYSDGIVATTARFCLLYFSSARPTSSKAIPHAFFLHFVRHLIHRKFQSAPQEHPSAVSEKPSDIESTLSTTSVAFRGSALAPDDFPLYVGQFLSTLSGENSANVEIREIGDILLSRGDTPASSLEDPPLWGHRATGSIGGYANGGLGCVIQYFLETLGNSKRPVTPVHLRVENARWRVGRGFLCTMGQSPKPAGSWRRFQPWDTHGQAIKAAALEIRGDHLVVAAGEEVFWRFYLQPPWKETGRRRGGGEGR